jgi:hypothetical protein
MSKLNELAKEYAQKEYASLSGDAALMQRFAVKDFAAGWLALRAELMKGVVEQREAQRDYKAIPGALPGTSQALLRELHKAIEDADK